jgi:hypothetical protein
MLRKLNWPDMHVIYPVILLIWGGMIIGLSFIATPAKFLAPHLSIPLALEIGNVTFHIFNKIEWGALISVSMILFFHRSSTFTKWLPIGIVLIILLLQTLWLLPILDQRVEVIITGGALEKSFHHWVYIIIEAGKAINLICTGAYMICKVKS